MLGTNHFWKAVLGRGLPLVSEPLSTATAEVKLVPTG